MWVASLVSLLVAVSLCVAASRYDLREGRIPNALTYPGILLGLFAWPAVGWALGGTAMAGELSRAAWIGFLSAALPYLVLVLSAGLGMGDMKLMAALGALTASWKMVLAVTVYALVAAVVMCLWIMIRRGLVWQTLGNILTAALHRASGADRLPPGGFAKANVGDDADVEIAQADTAEGQRDTPRRSDPDESPPGRPFPARGTLPTSGATVPFAVAVTAGLLVAGAEQVLGLPTPWRAYAP